MVIVLVFLTIAACLVVDYYVRRGQVERGIESAGVLARIGDPSVAARPTWGDASSLVRVPGGTYMAPGHAWLRPEADGSVRVGAGRLPLHALGGLDQVHLLATGSTVTPGDTIAVLVHGRRRVHLVSPVEGVIESVNTDVVTTASSVAEHPFGQGWLYAIRPKRLASALRRTFVADEAEGWMRREVTRMRDLLAELAPGGAAPAVALLDGGVPMDGLAGRLTDAQWSAVSRAIFDPPR